MKLKNCRFIIASILAIVALNPMCIFAQELSVKASFQGIPINSWTNHNDTDPGIVLDFNRDGVPDRPFIDPKNESLVILSGSSKQKWIVPLLSQYYKVEILEGRICGFYEMDGDTSTTEIVMADHEGNRFWSPVILRVDKSSTKLTETDELLSSPNYFLLGINDVDQDGKDDIIVADTTVKMIEILSY